MLRTVLHHFLVEQRSDNRNGVVIDVLREKGKIFFRVLRVAMQRKRRAKSGKWLDFAGLSVNPSLAQVSTVVTSSELAIAPVRPDTTPRVPSWEATLHPVRLLLCVHCAVP